jgi:hypothetical protein
VSHGKSANQGTRIMALREEKTRDCTSHSQEMQSRGCMEIPLCDQKGMHRKVPLAKCETFRKMKPKQRLAKVEERELCNCIRHLKANECWALGKVPNCNIKRCNALHHPLLHEALITGRAMIVQKVSGGPDQGHLCRKDVKVEVAGKTHRLKALHDWGATQTLITHVAAGKMGLVRIRHSARLLSGLGSKCLESTCFYVVPFVDGCNEVQTFKDTEVAQIATFDSS